MDLSPGGRYYGDQGPSAEVPLEEGAAEQVQPFVQAAQGAQQVQPFVQAAHRLRHKVRHRRPDLWEVRTPIASSYLGKKHQISTSTLQKSSRHPWKSPHLHIFAYIFSWIWHPSTSPHLPWPSLGPGASRLRAGGEGSGDERRGLRGEDAGGAAGAEDQRRQPGAHPRRGALVAVMAVMVVELRWIRWCFE